MGRKVNRRRKPEPGLENVHEFLSQRGLAASLGQRISLPLHGFINQAGEAPSVWARTSRSPRQCREAFQLTSKQHCGGSPCVQCSLTGTPI
jgi:hypothetical protein